jgi:hypothetical protein
MMRLQYMVVVRPMCSYDRPMGSADGRSRTMHFDTVVLFDVENLLGHPNRWKEAATELSFGDILAQLRLDESGLIGQFAVSRAYANWGLSALSTLRREMTEYGVEPRQIFAFDTAGKKNAADIELVIDALDLAYSRAGILTFVLVTRDGGFSSLGRKLHELGKAVVICADRECSKALRAVADAFVELPAPEEGILVLDQPAAVVGSIEGGDLGADGEQLLDEARGAVIAEINAMAGDRSYRLHDGVLLQTVGHRFRQAVPSLPIARSAYPGLKEFLQWATLDSPYCVFRQGDAQAHVDFFLGLRLGVPEGASVLPGLERRPPRVRDRVALYRLLASQGKPILRLPEPGSAAQILRAIASRGINSEDLSSVINDVADALAGQVSTADVKNVVILLARSSILEGDPPDAPLQDRTYTLAQPSQSVVRLRDALLSVVRDKLGGRLGTVEHEVLQRLVHE